MSDKNYPPDSWRYEGLAESAAQSLSTNDWITNNPELLTQQLMHLMTKAFEMGRECSRRAYQPKVPVQDLRHLPELFDFARARWEKGVCH